MALHVNGQRRFRASPVRTVIALHRTMVPVMHETVSLHVAVRSECLAAHLSVADKRKLVLKLVLTWNFLSPVCRRLTCLLRLLEVEKKH